MYKVKEIHESHLGELGKLTFVIFLIHQKCYKKLFIVCTCTLGE